MGPPRCGNTFLAAGLRSAFPALSVVGPGEFISPGHVNKHSVDDMRLAQGMGMYVVSPLRTPDESVRSFLLYLLNPRHNGPRLPARRTPTTKSRDDAVRRGSREWIVLQIRGYLQTYYRLVSYQIQQRAHFVDFTDVTSRPDDVLDQLRIAGALPLRRQYVNWKQIREATRPRNCVQVSFPDDVWSDTAVRLAMADARHARMIALTSQT